MTLTASTTADPGVIIGSPASVTTTVVDTSPPVPTPPDGTPATGTDATGRHPIPGTDAAGRPAIPGPTPPSVVTAVRMASIASPRFSS